MENFFYEDEFYSDIESLMDDLDLNTVDDVQALEDNYVLSCNTSELQPMITLSPNWITERIDEERFPEDESYFNKVENILLQHIDFDLINANMPKLYYPTRERFEITKEDLLNEFKP